MNLDFTDDERELAQVARGALSSRNTIGAARAALDGAPPPDLWPLAADLGWPGVLLTDDGEDPHPPPLPGFAAALLVHLECGRALASAGLLGHAGTVAALAPYAGHAAVAPLLNELTTGVTRGVFVPAVPGRRADWTMQADGRLSGRPGELPVAVGAGEAVTVTGHAAMVLDATENARLLVPVRRAAGAVSAAVVDGRAPGVKIIPARPYDRSSPTGTVDLCGAPGAVVPVTDEDLRRAWDVTQALLAAEALGVCEATLDMSVSYATRRRAFGRPIGTFQAVKHQLVEVLRHAENVRSLLCFAAVAAHDEADDFSLACACARLAAIRAAELATRACLGVHGAVGVTWEHDAHLYFRRAQLSRLLLGGEPIAAEHVVQEGPRAGRVG